MHIWVSGVLGPYDVWCRMYDACISPTWVFGCMGMNMNMSVSVGVSVSTSISL